MLNQEQWRPTKFELHDGRWRASRDPAQVFPASRLMADRVAAAYSRTIRAHARGDLLDLGCGHVPLYGLYRDLVASTICLDWPNTAHPSPHLDIEADLAESLPLEDQSFDTILATDVLEHLAYPDATFAEMRRVLRPGGRIILGVPFLYWLHEQPHDHHRYTEFRLRRFAEDHELEVLELSPYGDGLDVLVDVAGKLLARRSLLTRAVGAAMGVVSRRRPRGGGDMPLGYVLVAGA